MVLILAQYWWAFALLAIPFILILLHVMARGKAKVVALKWLAAAEKLVFYATDSKLVYVAQKAYSALSPRIKLFVPYALFSMLVMELYEEVKDLIEDMHKRIEK